MNSVFLWSICFSHGASVTNTPILNLHVTIVPKNPEFLRASLIFPQSSIHVRHPPDAHACCVSVVSADEAETSQGPQGQRPRAGARPRGLRSGLVHQPGRRMHAMLVDGEGGMRPCISARPRVYFIEIWARDGSRRGARWAFGGQTKTG